MVMWSPKAAKGEINGPSGHIELRQRTGSVEPTEILNQSKNTDSI
jgi:hypothetical protein